MNYPDPVRVRILPPTGWLRCAGCADWTPPEDIVDGYCSSCNDGRVFIANMQFDPDPLYIDDDEPWPVYPQPRPSLIARLLRALRKENRS